VNARPIGVQWKAVSKDVYEITLLTTYELRSGEASIRKLVPATTRVKWFPDKGANGGDWKQVATDDFDAPEGGELGTKAFNDGGYAAIAEERP
jgi:hypothetical protein